MVFLHTLMLLIINLRVGEEEWSIHRKAEVQRKVTHWE